MSRACLGWTRQSAVPARIRIGVFLESFSGQRAAERAASASSFFSL